MWENWTERTDDEGSFVCFPLCAHHLGRALCAPLPQLHISILETSEAVLGKGVCVWNGPIKLSFLYESTQLQCGKVVSCTLHSILVFTCTHLLMYTKDSNSICPLLWDITYSAIKYTDWVWGLQPAFCVAFSSKFLHVVLSLDHTCGAHRIIK